MVKRTQLNRVVSNHDIMMSFLIIPANYKEDVIKHKQLLTLRSMYTEYLYNDFSINTVSTQLAVYLDVNVIQEDDVEHKEALRNTHILKLT